MKKIITVSQKRILDILSDGKAHPLLSELPYNQLSAIKALEKKGLIKIVYEGGYWSLWQSLKQGEFPVRIE
jgi:hypothetical protein